ncbi:rRNA biogenesis protein, putative [Bodo saltans]|uniref:rRNA biogenesis protein, putative n=1 Tax=Bodo saltans TaxID=75058 RepID=A0A0S4J3E1_BODSA|nr:rRNA biogenesis protein, putative [Bodo saltans]|eukprot:CUG67689.1 rRNA biogenesis protein, putative [Bodo saltans]
MNQHEFKVHHATPDSVLVQLPDGGFGRLNAASLGGDALAERLLKHLSVRQTLVASPRRARDEQGYLILSCSLQECWSGVLAYPETVRLAMQELYRKNLIVPLGAVQHARVIRSTPKGTIYSIGNGITAVAPHEKIAAGVQANDVRIISYDTESGAVTVASDEGLVSHAPQDAADVAKACDGIAVGYQVTGTILAVSSSTSAVLDVTLPSGARVLVYYNISAAAAKARKPLAVGASLQAVLEYVPSSKELATLLPVLIASDRTPFDAIPAIRSVQPSTRTSGLFPWRDNSGYDAEEGRKNRRDADNDDRPLRKRRMEEAIDAYERQREEDQVPKSPEEFQKLLLGSPNSSFLWTHYMAFHLGLQQVEEARIVAEKALKTIGVRNTKELLNVWVAYLNIENAHGTAESLAAIFRRALQHSDDELVVHEKLADIFKASKKFQQLHALCRAMSSKFRNIPRVWERLGLALIEADKRDQLKRVIKDMGEALKKQEQCVIVEHLAIFEYRNGNVANGRALFEGLVSKLPKQSDLWSAFLDQEVGLITRKVNEGSITFVRDLFERVTSVSLSAKVMQQLLTRYLGFEQTHGNPQGVEKVKAKARAYVEGKIASSASTPMV